MSRGEGIGGTVQAAAAGSWSLNSTPPLMRAWAGGRKLTDKMEGLYRHKEAHQFVADSEWAAIDVAGIDEQITRHDKDRKALLQASDILQHLEAEEKERKDQLQGVLREKFTAEKEQEQLDLPLLTTDLRLRRAVEGSVRIEVLQGIETPA